MLKDQKIKVWGIIFLMLGVPLFATVFAGEDGSAHRFYSKSLDDYIEKCTAKEALLNSKSPLIRKTALRAVVKAAYLRANRENVLRSLHDGQVPLNPVRIAYHVNMKFMREVQPIKSYAMLSVDSK